MSDLSLDSSFDVFLDDRNDVATVDGVEEFEQSVAVMLTDYMYSMTGDTDFETLKEKIRLQTGRVARNHDKIDSVDRIVVERHPDEPSTLLVELIYNSNNNFSFDLTL
jgi:hypothetical protein